MGRDKASRQALTMSERARHEAQIGVFVLSLVLFPSPLNAQVQQTGQVAQLGLLGLFTPELGSRSVAALSEGLGDLGWREGQKMRYEHRYASGRRDQLAALATQLVQQKVDVIVAFGTDATRAAKGATSSIPIVMGGVADPVGSGFVTSLERPGGNVTGTSLLMSDLIGKQLQLLKEVVPRATRIGIISLGSQAGPQMKEAEVVGRRLGLTLHRIAVREPLTLDDLAPQLRTARVDAVLAVANPALDDVRTRIVEIINAQRLPSVFTLTYWQKPGGS